MRIPRGIAVIVAVALAGCGSAAPAGSTPAPSEGLPVATTVPSVARPSSSAAPSIGPSGAPSIAPSASPSARPSASAAPSSAPVSPATASGLPTTGANSYEHVFVVIFENHGYGQIVGASAAPTFNRLIRSGALSTAYHAVAHPSLPNYLALVGGSTFGITSDCSPASCPIHATNLGWLLSAHGRTWKAYMESMPRRCDTASASPYAVKHDPFVYFDDVRTTSLCQRVVPSTQLATDLRSNSTTPRFSFVTPNLCHDMHDCSIATGDAWLNGFARQLMASPAWTAHRSVLIVTFDEDNGASSNHVVTFAVGSPVRRTVKAGSRTSAAYTHFSLLRTIEYYLGVPTLGRKDATAHVMTGLVPS